MPIHCEIVSQDRIVFQDDVDMVVLPGASGEMGILAEPFTSVDALEVRCDLGEE